MTPSTTSAPVSGPEPRRLEQLAERIGHTFRDPSLLAMALAHRSWSTEAAADHSNERLEFLGDAVLGMVVAEHLFRALPEGNEHELSRLRSTLVSSPTLAEVAEELGLGDDLLLGKGEAGAGGREKPSILADATEAVIGAAYLDGGWSAASDLVLMLLGDRISDAAAGPGGQDYKTRLQELAARRFESLPEYDVVDDGPDHAKRFYAGVRVGDRRYTGGEGRSKKQAEQAAARLAWEALRVEEGADA